jgi:FtsP/CotA-like multicopper oxidase with cupredoxin domain
MAVVVEYANAVSTPRWQQPADLLWNYQQFTGAPPGGEAAESPTVIPLVFEANFRGHGAMEAWTINGRSYPDARVAPLQRGRRYRLQLINRSRDDHPLHLHRHSFELRSLGASLTAHDAAPADLHGIIKDVVLVDAQTHMDLGFMMLFDYA